MTNYSKGANFERRVKQHLEEHGWLCFRSAGSHSPADIIAMRGAGGTTLVLVVQCQLDKPFSAVKKKELRDEATWSCAHPLLAYRDGKEIKFEYVEVKDE